MWSVIKHLIHTQILSYWYLPTPFYIVQLIFQTCYVTTYFSSWFVIHVIKTFLAVYGCQRFITVVARNFPFVPYSVHFPTSCIFITSFDFFTTTYGEVSSHNVFQLISLPILSKELKLWCCSVTLFIDSIFLEPHLSQFWMSFLIPYFQINLNLCPPFRAWDHISHP